MKKFAVLGRPIAHSRSPQIHQCFAQDTHQELSYERRLVSEEMGFIRTIETFQRQGGNGANVTAPCKEDAFHWASTLTPRAQLAGAVNTITFNQDGSSLGDNTDGMGLIKDIRDFLGWPLKNKRILILGAGGAVRGILEPLLAQKPALIVLANRTLAKAQSLVAIFQSLGPMEARNFEACASEQFDILINTIPPTEPVPTLPAISFSTLCYDLIYADEMTPFLRTAQALGAMQIADGVGMLVEQAAESFYVWHGVRPNTLKARALFPSGANKK